MSSPPPIHSTGVGPAADSPAPQSPAIPGAESSPSTPDVRGDDGSGEGGAGGADLPMTMQASVILTSLPKDAKSALEGAGEVGVEKGEWLLFLFPFYVSLERCFPSPWALCQYIVLFFCSFLRERYWDCGGGAFPLPIASVTPHSLALFFPCLFLPISVHSTLSL